MRSTQPPIGVVIRDNWRGYWQGSNGVNSSLAQWKWLRSISSVVLIVFIATTLQPFIASAQTPYVAKGAGSFGEEESLQRTLAEIEDTLKQSVPEVFAESGVTQKRKAFVVPQVISLTAAAQSILAKQPSVEKLFERTRHDFSITERFLKKGNLPADILQRHAETMRILDARYQQYTQYVTALERAVRQKGDGSETRSAMKALAGFVTKYARETLKKLDLLDSHSEFPVIPSPFSEKVAAIRRACRYQDPLRA